MTDPRVFMCPTCKKPFDQSEDAYNRCYCSDEERAKQLKELLSYYGIKLPESEQ